MADHLEFDKWAASYDDEVASEAFPFIGYRDVLRTVVDISAPHDGMHVLDVGVGTGALSVAVYEAGALVCAVDFSQRMIDKARARLPRAEFEIVDVAEDGFGRFNDRRFDRVISSYFLHHFTPSQQVQFIAESCRLNLKPGGKLVIGDIGFPSIEEMEMAHRKFRDLWDEDEYYLCGGHIVSELATTGIAAQYRQVSECAGVLVVDA